MRGCRREGRSGLYLRITKYIAVVGSERTDVKIRRLESPGVGGIGADLSV